MISPRLIIGGSSSVGKTTVARQLAAHFDCILVETDRSLPDDPRLNPLAGPPEIWDEPAAELCARLIVSADVAVTYLRRQARDLSDAGNGWIMEGERVHPRLVECLSHEDVARGVFIVETDAQRLYETLMARLPGFMTLAESRRRAVAKVDKLYNVWLVEEASRRNLPCVESQPWLTLADRLLAEV
jgi:2-phosphoglycerate kinase